MKNDPSEILKGNYILNIITEVEWWKLDAEQDEGPEVLKNPVDEEARDGIKGEQQENDLKQSYCQAQFQLAIAIAIELS